MQSEQSTKVTQFDKAVAEAKTKLDATGFNRLRRRLSINMQGERTQPRPQVTPGQVVMVESAWIQDPGLPMRQAIAWKVRKVKAGRVWLLAGAHHYPVGRVVSIGDQKYRVARAQGMDVTLRLLLSGESTENAPVFRSGGVLVGPSSVRICNITTDELMAVAPSEPTTSQLRRREQKARRLQGMADRRARNRAAVEAARA